MTAKKAADKGMPADEGTVRACSCCGDPLPDNDSRRMFCSGACRARAQRLSGKASRGYGNHNLNEEMKSARMEELRERLTALSAVDFAYFAGLFDGEGSIGAYAPYFNLHLTMTNTHKGVLNKLQDAFGGGIYLDKEDHPNRKTRWVWQITNGPLSQVVLAALLPYLVIKKPEAEIALTMPVFRSYTHQSDEQRKAKSIVGARLKVLKRAVSE